LFVHQVHSVHLVHPVHLVRVFPMTEALKRIARARANLILKEPFFGTLLLRLQAQEDPACAGIWTDGRTLGVNPSFALAAAEAVLEGVLCHEILHLVLGHHLRRGSRTPSRWNVATDYAVNALVLQEGLQLPEDRLFDERFSRMEAERIYPLLEKERKSSGPRQQGSSTGQAGGRTSEQRAEFGEVRDFSGNEKERLEERASWESALREAAIAAQSWGKVPASARRLLPELDRARMNWREILSRFLEEASRNDYSWSTPNRRYAQTGFSLPILADKTFGTLVLMVDTSGSISREDLAGLATECLGILSLYQEEATLTVFYVDCRLAGVQVLSQEEKPLPVGGGGTSYRPGFQHLLEEEMEPAGVVYFTDGQCADFPDEPDCPVLWVLPRDNPWFRHRVPFGEVVCLHMELEQEGRKRTCASTGA
jgi:predicted metal-dependent peptidase